MKRNSGFSLLELLIVVAIILIIATIAVPSLLRSRQAANETAAVANLKLVNTAEVTYTASGTTGYGTIDDLVSEGLLDSRFSTAISGYVFTINVTGGGTDYTATAIVRGANDGRYDYYSRPDYIIRYSANVARAPTGLTAEPVR